MEKNLGETIHEAIVEAQILEMGMDNTDQERMLLNAMRLSGAPWSFVEQVFSEMEKERA